MNTVLLVVYTEDNGLVSIEGKDMSDLNASIKKAFDEEMISDYSFRDGSMDWKLFILTPAGGIEEKYLEPYTYVQFQPKW